MTEGHGDDTYRYPDIRVNFSSNVYNHFSHRQLYDYLATQLPLVTSYPHPTAKPLEEALAAHLGLEPSQVVATNGVTEAIYLIALAFRRSHSAILVPTFTEYADACRLHEHRVTLITRLDELPPTAQMLWLCCPNNPTGHTIPLQQLREAIQSHPQTIFVIDASYAAFTLEPLLSPAEAVGMPNVIMLHSLTKRFALPGLRLGFLSAPAPFSLRCRSVRQPWSVNTLAIRAALWLLSHADLYPLPLQLLHAERALLAQSLAATGSIQVHPSDTHILLARLSGATAAQLKDHLASHHGLLIRDCSNIPGLTPYHFRVALQSPPENRLLLSALLQFLHGSH